MICPLTLKQHFKFITKECEQIRKTIKDLEITNGQQLLSDPRKRDVLLTRHLELQGARRYLQEIGMSEPVTIKEMEFYIKNQKNVLNAKRLREMVIESIHDNLQAIKLIDKFGLHEEAREQYAGRRNSVI